MKSISFRLTLWYSLVATATVGVILIFGRYYLEDRFVEGIDLLNDAEFAEISNRLHEHVEVTSDSRVVGQAVINHTEIDAALFYFQIWNQDRSLYFTSANLGEYTLAEPPGEDDHYTFQDEELGRIRVGRYDLAGITILIASSLDNEVNLFSAYRRSSIVILAVVFMISILLGYLMSRLALNPIAHIQKVARRVTARKLDATIPVPNTGDEVAHLAELLNDMLTRLRLSFDQIARFTADASHELRTPLSLIRLHTERLLNNPELPQDEQQKALQDQMSEIEQLNKLIDDLLFLAKADAGVMSLKPSDTDIDAFLADFKEDAEVLCDEQGLSFKLILENEPVARIDTAWMRNVLLNLLSNALKVSPKGGLITIRSGIDKQIWKLSVADEGPGLKTEELEHIFDRFARSQRDHQSETKGTGLGLAICRSIIEKHNGTISARGRENMPGLEFIISIPL